QVTNDFYQLLRAQSLAQLSVQQVEQANQQLQLVLGKIAAGAEAAVNRYQFDVALANAQVTLLENQNAVRQNGAALRAAMGLPVGAAGARRAREHEARAGLGLAQARESQTRIDISNTVQQAILNIQNSQQRLDASRVAAEAAARNLEAENARYQQGLAIP